MMAVEQATPDTLERAAKAIAGARRVVALTGAGISSESGVPTFRGPGGLWRQFRPEDLANLQAFSRNPALVWAWYFWRRQRIAEARPNAGHECLARLERRLPAFTLVTQNVDGLHRQAGSARVVELHGNIWRSVCARRCGVVLDESPWRTRLDPAYASPEPNALPRCACGSLLRPDVVWFGESLDAEVLSSAIDEAQAADVMLVIGTSGLVHPAAALPDLARRSGATTIEINVEPTPLSDSVDIVLRGPSGVVLPALEARL
jgi:NAD-dependent deacetylase